MIPFRLAWLTVVAVAMSACASLRKDLPVGNEVDFGRHIKPILEGRCVNCHNRQSMPDRISFETRELALTTGEHGRAIIPGDPDNSRILNFINAPHDTKVSMPRSGHGVTAEEAETIREWIAAGARWPDGKAGRLVPATDR